MSIQCEICGRFISYADFENGKTQNVEAVPATYYEPPEYGPAHSACVENKINSLVEANDAS